MSSRLPDITPDAASARWRPEHGVRFRSSMDLEEFFDEANRDGTGILAPPVLYHYTSWKAAEAILRSQRFRASAHDCTNDIAELAAADAAILDEVRTTHHATRGTFAKHVLSYVLDNYDDLRLGASRRAYLVCFSTRRDDSHQWCEYGGRGAGVCIGLRIFDVDAPRIDGVTTLWMPVSYGDFQLRRTVRSWLKRFAADCDRAANNGQAWRVLIDAFNVTASAWAVATKERKWLPEHEVRGIFLARRGRRIEPVEEPRPDGSVKRYTVIPLTSADRMPLHELTIGPNQDAAIGRERALNVLRRCGYTDVEQKVIVSAARLDCEEESR